MRGNETIFYLILIICGVAAAFLFLFYRDAPDGGECEYKEIAGIANIVSVSPSQKDHFAVRFDFEPMSADIAQNSSWKQMLTKPGKVTDLILLSRNGDDSELGIPRKTIDNLEISVGAHFPCTMVRRTNGTCIPVYFKFPSLAEFEGHMGTGSRSMR